MKWVIAFILFTQLILPVQAQETKQLFSEAVIQNIEISSTEANLTLQTTRDELAGRTFSVTMSLNELERFPAIQKGSEVFVSYLQESNGQETVYIADIVRKQGITLLFIFFILLVVFIGRGKGIRGIISMGISFAIVFFGMLPLMVKGYNPAVVATVALAAMVPLMFYVTHGFSTKTHVSVISTYLTFIAVVALAYGFTQLLYLTGYGGSESVFLQTVMEPGFNLLSLYIAGIVIGVMGVLDDITISQAGIVEKLYAQQKIKNLAEVARHAMDLGRDHIASLVNTLVLVYMGSALPLMLLFYQNTMPSFLIINQEIIVAELLRMFVGSMGVIMAVPIATYIAILFLKRGK